MHITDFNISCQYYSNYINFIFDGIDITEVQDKRFSTKIFTEDGKQINVDWRCPIGECKNCYFNERTIITKDGIDLLLKVMEEIL